MSMEQWLDKLVSSFITKYKGCNIVSRDGAFYWADKRYETEQSAKDEIDRLTEFVESDQTVNRLKNQ